AAAPSAAETMHKVETRRMIPSSGLKRSCDAEMDDVLVVEVAEVVALAGELEAEATRDGHAHRERVAQDGALRAQLAGHRHIADAAQAVAAQHQIERPDRHLDLAVEALLEEPGVEHAAFAWAVLEALLGVLAER